MWCYTVRSIHAVLQKYIHAAASHSVVTQTAPSLLGAHFSVRPKFPKKPLSVLYIHLPPEVMYRPELDLAVAVEAIHTLACIAVWEFKGSLFVT